MYCVLSHIVLRTSHFLSLLTTIFTLKTRKLKHGAKPHARIRTANKRQYQAARPEPATRSKWAANRSLTERQYGVLPYSSKTEESKDRLPGLCALAEGVAGGPASTQEDGTGSGMGDIWGPLSRSRWRM